MSGLCAGCYQLLPAVAKASRSTRVDVIIARYAARMVETYGPHSADILMWGAASAADEVPASATDWAAWREAMRVVVRDESEGVRSRRRLRTERRAKLIRHVPPPAATLDPGQPGNAFGKTRRGARPRAELPMRVAVALWGLGLGPKRVHSVAARADVQISTSAIGRILVQSQNPFDGAVPEQVGRLARGLVQAAR